MVARRILPYELLICDDDSSFRQTLRAVLEPYFRLVEASSGEEAIDIVQHEPVDLALLDMHMHRLTGLETLRQLKCYRAQLPCILITADATGDLRQEAQAAKAFTVLSKPVRRRELMTSVQGALKSVDPGSQWDDWWDVVHPGDVIHPGEEG